MFAARLRASRSATVPSGHLGLRFLVCSTLLPLLHLLTPLSCSSWIADLRQHRILPFIAIAVGDCLKPGNRSSDSFLFITSFLIFSVSTVSSSMISRARNGAGFSSGATIIIRCSKVEAYSGRYEEESTINSGPYSPHTLPSPSICSPSVQRRYLSQHLPSMLCLLRMVR